MVKVLELAAEARAFKRCPGTKVLLQTGLSLRIGTQVELLGAPEELLYDHRSQYATPVSVYGNKFYILASESLLVAGETVPPSRLH